MNGSLAVVWQYLIPQRLVCSVVYRAARSRRRWFARPLIRWFVASYGLDLGEAANPDIEAYASLNDLFTRALGPGVRPIDADPAAIVAPADGVLTRAGTIDRDTLIQAKGMTYSLQALIGEDDAPGFDGGAFATIYLAPHNYHRVHVPLGGRLTQTRFIPGARFSVNTATAAAVPRLFCRNERVVFRLETAAFAYYLVMVGALNVASISTVTRGEIASGTAACWPETDRPAFAKGDEIGRFNLGSTAIVVLPAGTAGWLDGLADDTPVRLGERIGRLTGTDAR